MKVRIVHNRGLAIPLSIDLVACVAAMILLNNTPILGAQSSQLPGKALPSFDVASVRPNKSDGSNVTYVFHDDNTVKITYTDTPLFYCLQKAFNLKDYQILGPAWVKSARYDILASGPYSASDSEAWQSMLQTLLRDRFAMRFHRATRKLPVYALTIAMGGPKLAPSKPGDGSGASGRGGRMEFNGMSMARLADILSNLVDRPVIDRTGISGTFTFSLSYSREMQTGVPDRPNGTAEAVGSGPSIFTALDEQLGLKLRPTKTPVEILVIDHVEQPSPN